MRNFRITQTITDRQDASLGLYFKDVSCISLISPEEEVILSEKVKQGDIKALHKLVNSNLRFVISVAKQYQNKGLSLVDLIQEGNYGLLVAAESYDPTKGFRFISYAVWWIRQAILKAITDQCRTVRIPMSQVSSTAKVSKISEKFLQDTGRRPTKEELTELTELTIGKINRALDCNLNSVSLDTPLGDDKSECLLDLIPNDIKPSDEEATSKDRIIKIISILKKLPNRESDVIRMLYGIEIEPQTIEEIAEKFGVGTERIRQIHQKGINIIKSKYKNELLEVL